MNFKIMNIKLLVVCIALFCGEQVSFSQSPIPVGAVLEKVATGFQQPEGPVWKDGIGLLFSDIKANKIYRWSPIDSSLVEYLNPSDSSNGLTFDRQGCLILTQMAKRRVARQELNGTITPLTSTYNGKKYNSPNDIVVKSDGSVYFTDPDFNTPKGQSPEIKFKGVFRLSRYGVVYALDSTTFDKPNGICFSPDEKKLYVNESPRGQIYAWDVVNDSMISGKKLLYTVPVTGYVDGMKTDSAGNIYCTGPTGVWIVSPQGGALGKIDVPVTPSNCNWGDADKKTLYITGGNSLYRIRLGAATGIKSQGSLPPKIFELYGNYPNPFNPATTIFFQLPYTCRVTLNVYDIQGRKIDTLLDGTLQSGYHNVQFTPGGIGSGIYLYRLIADAGEMGIYSASRKMIVIK
jgi:gluconolactonase